MSDSTSAQRFADLVRDAGYKAVVDEEGTGINSAANGLKFSAQLYGNRTVQFYMGVMLSNERFDPAAANEFNKTYRFAKCYVIDREDGSRSALLETDFFLDIDAETAAADVDRCFDSWSITLRNFMEYLSKIVHGEGSDDA